MPSSIVPGSAWKVTDRAYMGRLLSLVQCPGRTVEIIPTGPRDSKLMVTVKLKLGPEQDVIKVGDAVTVYSP